MISALNFRIALIAVAIVNFYKPAAANPTNPSVVNGTATITNPNANTLQITNSPGAIINWQGFSINAGEITQFLQSSPASAILNRVTGTDPSQILGTLQSNGRVFLINPNGIVFGAGALVDVQGLIASTLDISNNDFLSGNYNFLQTSAGAPITLQNGAQITTANAGNGGQVWLIARSIEQAGNITTPGGQTILAAGTNVQVASSALGNMVFNVTTDGTNDIQSLGSIAANQGVAGLFADNITHSGTINAQSVGGVQGQVVMNADNNLIVQDGGVINANSSDGSNAGKINLTAGNQLEVQRIASVSADGAISGGNGGQINLTAYDLRVSSVANASQNLHASARNPSAVNGTVTLNQTGNPSFSPGGELIVSYLANDDYPGNEQYSPSITALADGGYVVTWGSKDNGNDDIYAQRYDANGNAVGSEFVVSNAPTAEYSPTITALADGGFVIAWRSRGNLDILLQRYDIYAQRYDASGKAIGEAFAISDPTAIHLSSEPAIAALADGGFVTTWASTTRVDGPSNVYDSGVYGRRYDAMGNALGSEFLISNIGRSLSSRPTIATLSDGSFVVTWGSDSGLLARRYNATGNAVGSEFLINEVGLQASLAPLVNGGFVVTWTERNFTNRYDVYARRYDANGNAVENKFLISLGDFNNGTAILHRVNPAISSLADGGFIVTWENFFNSGLYFDIVGFVNLYAQRYDASGNKVGSEFLVSNKGTRTIPSIITSANGIAALDNGGFVGTWASNQSRNYSYSTLRRYDKVPAPFTQDDNQVTGELGTIAGFNTRPGLSNAILSSPPSGSTVIPTPPPSGSTVIPTLPSKVEQELALSNAVCATLSPSPNREPLPEGEEAFRLLSTNATGLNCPGQSNSQMHSDAIGKGWNNSTQAPPQEQAYAQMVGEQEYTLTRAMSWKARQAYWNEHSQKQSTLSAEEYTNYLNQVQSLSESERVQRYEQLGQQLP
jgi:filamentous hemagglutinin family protein